MNLSQANRIGKRALTTLALVLLPLGLAASAQDKPAENSCMAARNSSTETKTFFLTNVSQYDDANAIMTAIRNVVCPDDKIFLVGSNNAIVVSAPTDQLAIVQRLVNDLDKPSKTYRLTYTITDSDAGKAIGTQHLSMVVTNGQHTSMKEGSKIPVATGSIGKGDDLQTQFTYVDIGMNFDSTISEIANGVRLQSKVEQSSLGQPSSIAGVTEPVVRQTVLQGTSFLKLGKPVMLGSVDVPNTTHHFDIAVVLDEVK